jgi:hypothetical protein
MSERPWRYWQVALLTFVLLVVSAGIGIGLAELIA